MCPTDGGPPVIKGHAALKMVLHEEHGIVADENDELAYLQKIEYIPGHCCTTVNAHDTYWCVRNGLLETTWPILGRGKSR